MKLDFWICVVASEETTINKIIESNPISDLYYTERMIEKSIRLKEY